MSATDPLVEQALAYACQGRRVFPVNGKRPYTVHGFHDATTDEATIRGWWSEHPDAGIATPTGPDWFVLDVDQRDALAALVAEHGPLPVTVEAVTPRPGRHIYLLGEVTNRTGGLPDGLDVRGTGGYIVLPPSPHENGVYEWRTALDEAPIAPAPAWLLELLRTSRNGDGGAPVDGDIQAPLRNTTLASMAGTMRRRGFHEAAIVAALGVTNRDRCTPPLSDAEVRQVARSVARYPAGEAVIATTEELTALLALDAIGKRIDTVKVFGRGSRAAARILLDNGERIVLDPLGAFSAGIKMTVELALQVGASPALKVPEVTRIMVLLYHLADHVQELEDEDRAWDHGVSYLRAAPVEGVRMGDQASRWEAFSLLASQTPQPPSAAARGLVLVDVDTGDRYVRAQWFGLHVREVAGVGDADKALRLMPALGWVKPGSEGRVKATRPGFRDTLQWAFFVVPTGWEDA
jgi:hypothetical protein